MVLANYYYSHHIVRGTTNAGELLNPPVKLTALLAQKGRWVLLYVDTSCDKLCVDNQDKLRNIRLATGKNQTRVTVLPMTEGAFTLASGTYIVDPLGNAILYYKKEANPKDIFKDLTRLLRISQIG